MTEHPVISFVVPVYNTEKYLDRCVESLVVQSFSNIEIILVNDGSTDDSQQKCEEWARRDHRIRVISQANHGLSGARNRGIEEAIGDFVGFVDSDDYVYPQFAETAIGHFSEGHSEVDIVVLGIVDNYAGYRSVSTRPRDECVPYSECFRLSLLGEVPGSICNRVFRREALANLRFRRGRWYEDMYFIGDCVGKLRQAHIDLEPLYVYDHRPGSITTVPFDTRVLDCIRSAENCVKIAESMTEDVKIAARFRATWSRFNVLDRMLQSNMSNEIRYRKLKQAIVRDLRGRTKEVIASPNFSSGRKFAAVALLISEYAYACAINFKAGVR